jgi:hypothetical protein
LDVNFFEDLPDFLTPNETFVELDDLVVLAAIISFI